METVKELIHGSVGLLGNNGIASAEFSRPHYPTCVVYFGERSSKYHRDLLEDITRGWGGNADYIKFYTVENVDSRNIKDALSGSDLTAFDVKTQITDLLSSQNVFTDMTRIALYCVVDTTDVKSAEEFGKWYSTINFVEDTIGVSTLSMLMVILNESLQMTALAKGIKNKIRDLYQDENVGGKNTHLYDSVFVFGNRLKNGSFIKIDPTESDYANFNLFADIVLLTNTRCPDYNDRRAHLYGSGKPALTAAYGFVQKPMAEIVMISLTIIMSKLKGLLATQTVDADMLTNALEINKGRSEVYERFYSEIKELLPPREFMNWLPGKATPDRTFDEFNRTTDGCLQKFLEQNHFEVVDAELLNRSDFVTKEIVALLSGALNAAQLVNGISNEVRRTVFDKAEIALGNPDKLQVQAAIDMKVKKAIAIELRAKSNDALTAAVQKAETCMEQFKQLCSELEKMFAVGEEGTRKNLTTFYGDKIQRYFNDTSKLNALFQSILKIENDKAAMLQILLEAIEVFFESDPVYKLSFSEELIERLGNVDTEKRAQEFIGQELIKNLDERVSYFSKHVFQTRTFEAYLLNTKGTNNNLLFRYLNDRAIPPEVTRTFFNTCNNDMAESIWFYACSVDNLSL
ncbi:hypothetical protein Hs30E_10590 [Lactococcus hodotermopsidis]|uniref:Uncharacterized protein n=1 Tax=Pseudolactococcus hodotermopsidis TaxID=2709157 RepID=A0A6A0BDT8_9LACT|nr:hypothetical protein [Lactococcus hodotermopsidis]GFH42508.1 hypothetical protein Hs30E_10590 [Lactococcus hodotermopsidis]